MTVNVSKSQFNLREKLKELERPSSDKLVQINDDGKVYIDKLGGIVNLSNIHRDIVDTAVDIFIYDTSKDSDGGAWRKRTTHTSWYNESLNTATRGSRKEFPAVAVIVATAASSRRRLIIYDGDDPNLPMWMIVDSTDGQWHQTETASPVYALNGIIALGSSSDGQPLYATRNRLDLFNFISDKIEGSTNSATYEGVIQGIVNRSDVAVINKMYGSNPYSLVNYRINDVAMTVLPNAPIDSATGLPTPTIAVATAGGVSVIKDDGSVVDITASAGSSYNSSKFISMSSDGLLVFPQHGSSATNGEYSLMTIPIPSSDRTTQTNSGNATDKYIFNDPNSSLGSLPHGLGVSQNGALRIPGTQFLNYPNGLAILDENPTSLSKAMVAYIKFDHNTGWMHGDIKGAFLSDTDDTNKTNGQTDPDRSHNNSALTVYGTVTKSAVATGAELVAYGPFTDSNYLKQPYNSDLNFGTSNFSIMFWIKSATHSTYSRIMNRVTDTNNNRMEVYSDSGTNLTFYTRDNSSASYVSVGNDSLVLNEWHCIVCTRESTGRMSMYIDGDQKASNASPNIRDLTSSTAEFRIGNAAHWDDGNPFPGQLSLIRISGSVPSAEQIKKMYDDEKHLFTENAKATLYGSSDAVTALAFDEVTERLHVGTSSGRSDFQGLRRINNTTTAVTTAISAHDEFIIEQ
jgi:hypothetical protein